MKTFEIVSEGGSTQFVNAPDMSSVCNGMAFDDLVKAKRITEVHAAPPGIKIARTFPIYPKARLV